MLIYIYTGSRNNLHRDSTSNSVSSSEIQINSLENSLEKWEEIVVSNYKACIHRNPNLI